jgi:uncharacterized protein YjbI with pentapeptide repeats
VDEQQQARRRQRLWAVGIIVGLVGVIVFLCLAYVREWRWTGLVKYNNFHERTLWDWLDLLIVPAVLALGGYLFARSESQRTQQNAQRQLTLDRDTAAQRRQDDTLQAYLDGMSQLLTNTDLPSHSAKPSKNLCTVARARTLTVLDRLDSGRKRSVLQFLFESGLIYREHTLRHKSNVIGKRYNIVSLKQANLSEANLSEANLRTVDLRKADLRKADLGKADLRRADLRRADLREAKLGEADLSRADLTGANLRTVDLRGADLREAKVHWAKLSGAKLDGTKLQGGLGWSEKQLNVAKSFEEATMPDGQKYEDWLKDDEGSGETGESGGPS